MAARSHSHPSHNHTGRQHHASNSDSYRYSTPVPETTNLLSSPTYYTRMQVLHNHHYHHDLLHDEPFLDCPSSEGDSLRLDSSNDISLDGGYDQSPRDIQTDMGNADNDDNAQLGLEPEDAQLGLENEDVAIELHPIDCDAQYAVSTDQPQTPPSSPSPASEPLPAKNTAKNKKRKSTATDDTEHTNKRAKRAKRAKHSEVDEASSSSSSVEQHQQQDQDQPQEQQQPLAEQTAAPSMADSGTAKAAIDLLCAITELIQRSTPDACGSTSALASLPVFQKLLQIHLTANIDAQTRLGDEAICQRLTHEINMLMLSSSSSSTLTRTENDAPIDVDNDESSNHTTEVPRSSSVALPNEWIHFTHRNLRDDTTVVVPPSVATLLNATPTLGLHMLGPITDEHQLLGPQNVNLRSSQFISGAVKYCTSCATPFKQCLGLFQHHRENFTPDRFAIVWRALYQRQLNPDHRHSDHCATGLSEVDQCYQTLEVFLNNALSFNPQTSGIALRIIIHDLTRLGLIDNNVPSDKDMNNNAVFQTMSRLYFHRPNTWSMVRDTSIHRHLMRDCELRNIDATPLALHHHQFEFTHPSIPPLQLHTWTLY